MTKKVNDMENIEKDRACIKCGKKGMVEYALYVEVREMGSIDSNPDFSTWLLCCKECAEEILGGKNHIVELDYD